MSWWAHFVFLTAAFGFLALALIFLYSAVREIPHPHPQYLRRSQVG